MCYTRKYTGGRKNRREDLKMDEKLLTRNLGRRKKKKKTRAAVCSHSMKGRQANTSSRYAAALLRDASRALNISDCVRTFFLIDFRDGFSNPITHFAIHSGFVLLFPLLCPPEAAAFVTSRKLGNAPRVCPPAFVGLQGPETTFQGCLHGWDPGSLSKVLMFFSFPQQQMCSKWHTLGNSLFFSSHYFCLFSK